MIVTNSDEEARLKKELESRTDAESRRMLRYLNLPDLSRTTGSPIYELVQRIVKLPGFKDFDLVAAPEITPAEISFDLFDFPADHPARSRSDTYYVDDQHILRTHTTVMWYYHLQDPAVRASIQKGGPIGALSYGKVYRKDEIDRSHMNIFHQMDGWYLTTRDKKIIGVEDLQNVLIAIARAVFGEEVKYRFNEDSFPYTDPSLEMEVERDGRWVEILGCGVVSGRVLQKLGVNPEQYNGWAFGMGIERLAILSMNLPDIRLLWSRDPRVTKQLKLDQKFQEVSKYPPITRDISFVVGKDFVPNNYFDLIRDIGGDIVEEVELLDKYADAAKFGSDKISYTYRVVYRSPDRTLKVEEVEPLQDRLYEQTKVQFKADLR